MAAQLILLRSQMHAWGPPKLRQLRTLRCPRKTDWNVPFVVRRQQGGDDWRRKGEGRGTCWITAVQPGEGMNERLDYR